MKDQGGSLPGKGRVFFAALLLTIVATAWAATDLKLTSNDGITIGATYVDTGQAKSKGLILLHMMQRQRQDYAAFAEAARQKGYCSLAIDLRGHGQSLTGPNGVKLNLDRFGSDDFAAMLNDVDAAYRYLVEQKNVDPQRVGIVGASIGANLAVNYAWRHQKRIKAVALLSPGLNYRGVTTDEPATEYPGPMLFYAAKTDGYAHESAQKLLTLAGARGTAKLYGGGGHGTALFDLHKEMIGDIIAWFDGKL